MSAAKHIGCVFAALLAFALLGASAGDAAPTPYATLISLINNQQFDEARALGESSAKTERARRLNRAFVDALILKRQGRYAEAVASFRAILAENPGFVRVRGELADTLFLMGDDKAAGYQFGLLSAAASTTTDRSIYTRYLNAIRDRRPFNWDGFVSVAPSSNLNGGTEDGTVEVGGIPFTGAKRESGVGLAFGGSATYRFDLDSGRELIVGGGATGALYADHAFDRLNTQVFTELAREAGPWRFGLGVGGEWMLNDWQTYRWGVGPQGSVRRSFGRAGTFVATASWHAMQYSTDTFYDGSEANVALNYSYAFNPATTIVLGTSVSRRMTTTSVHDYTGVRPSVQLYHEMRNGLIGDAALSYEHRFFDGDYYLLNEPRRDDVLDVTLGLTFRKMAWKGFAPRLQYDFEMYNSNSEHGNTTSHSLGLTLTKAY